MDATRPHGVGPVLAQPVTRQRLLETRCRPPNTRRRHIAAVRAARDSSSPDPRPIVARSHTCCRLLHTCRRPNCDPFFNLRTRCHASFLLLYLSSPKYYSSSAEFTRRRKLCTRRRLPPLVVAKCVTRRRDPFHTRPVPVHAISISTRACSFLRTSLKHPGLHLPRQLLAGFSTRC